ncbi:uncharacterized protein [Leptinotarsa decemlineata]|uniref:uncharacterized protein n=1 Tax=Leptinotarsa decemlineata TaxID=7539 RepID=UPI000C251AD6|nr:60S ribosomal protein L23a [Leptinotarsa decemlineata]
MAPSKPKSADKSAAKKEEKKKPASAPAAGSAAASGSSSGSKAAPAPKAAAKAAAKSADKKPATSKTPAPKPAAAKAASSSKAPAAAPKTKATASKTTAKAPAGKATKGAAKPATKKPTAAKAAPGKAKAPPKALIAKPKKNVPVKQQKGVGKKSAASAPISKALKVQKKVIKGPNGTHSRKIRTSVHFHRPTTLRPPRQPKYPRKSVPTRSRMDAYNIIKFPLTTEAAMKKIEDNNTLVFLVHTRANKYHIKAAVKKLYDINVAKVNTLIRPDGKKKAYVRLARDYDALDVANKIGII